MMQQGLVLITDRGGHLHNALMLLAQMDMSPEVLVTTSGPDIEQLKENPRFNETQILWVPYLFSWVGKFRFWNPFKFFYHIFVAAFHVMMLRPKWVISLGGSNVILFCYWAKLKGAKIYHVECMNQVISKSITGRLLYPVCTALYVQWKELLKHYGPKAQYEGWVL